MSRKEATTTLVEFGNENMARYGIETLMNRSIPALADGLKPVQRRILYSLHDLGVYPNKSFMKAGRVVGDVLGRFHPHGDSSIYEAMVNMANSTTPVIDGQGNWGGIADRAGAYRYTECRLTQFAAEAFFTPEYMAVMKTKTSYDDKTAEPEYLSAIECGLLINGVEGISVGARCIIPGFTRESVANAMLLALKKKRLTAKDLVKTLVFDFKYGARILPGGENRKAIEAIFTKGKASLRLAPKVKYDEKNRNILITGFTGAMHSGTLVETIANHPMVQVTEDLTDDKGPKRSVTLKRDVDFKEGCEKVLKLFQRLSPYSIAYIVPKKNKFEFKEGGVIDVIYDWLEIRRDLEKRMLQHKLDRLAELEERLLLMKLAHDKRKQLDECRDKKDPKAWLISKLKFRGKKLEPHHATFLLNLTVMQLTKIHKGEIEKQIKAALEERKSLKKQLGNVDANLVKQFKETGRG